MVTTCRHSWSITTHRYIIILKFPLLNFEKQHNICICNIFFSIELTSKLTVYPEPLYLFITHGMMTFKTTIGNSAFTEIWEPVLHFSKFIYFILHNCQLDHLKVDAEKTCDPFFSPTYLGLSE